MNSLNQPELAASASAAEVAEKREANLARRAELGEMKRARTRATVLQAAVKVLGHEQGRLATIDNVIAEAGISRGTFYNYFEGRDQLLSAVAFELMHEFTCAVRSSLESEPDITFRITEWIRRYLHRVRENPRWGWALVNVSLVGPELFGEEAQKQARVNLAIAMASNEITVPSVAAVLDQGWGSVLAAAITILRGQAPPDHPEQIALLILRALKVPERKAMRAISMPLHDLPVSVSDED